MIWNKLGAAVKTFQSALGMTCSKSSPGAAQRPAYRTASSKERRGSALLAVLWLSAALSAIAFTVANTVRAETERTATDVDSLKTYYLATGAIERALLYMQYGGHYYQPPTPLLRFPFPSGEARVEIIPESAKLNVNSTPPSQLQSLLLALGVEAQRAQSITEAIVDWRTPSPDGAFTGFDQYYLSLTPSFRATHASLEEIEELLLIRGITPELFYGGYSRDADGHLIPHAGLKDCLSVWAAPGPIDVNTAEPAVMQAIGISPSAVAGIVALRNNATIQSMEQLAAFRDSGPGFSRLGTTGGTFATLRATARLRLSSGQLSDLQRSVSAMIKFFGFDNDPSYQIMRWYDNAFTTQ